MDGRNFTQNTANLLSQCQSLRILKLTSARLGEVDLNHLGRLPNLKELDLTHARSIPSGVMRKFIKAHPMIGVKQ